MRTNSKHKIESPYYYIDKKKHPLSFSRFIFKDVDSFLNLTSGGGDESSENEQITLIVDSDSSFSPNDNESGFEDDNVLCEISQNRKDRIENKDTGNKRNNNKDSEEEDETIDGRKRRHRNPENWKVNIQKNARLRGLEYIGIGGMGM